MPGLLSAGAPPAAGAGADPEDVLVLDQIQGNIIGGFNKDHQTVLFLVIDDPAAFKAWLKVQADFVSTAAEVLAFNRLFKELRLRRGGEGAVKATWFNLALSHAGLVKLIGPGADGFDDGAFTDGHDTRSPLLGDPADSANLPGSPRNWVFGGTSGEAPDVILIVAADDRCDMLAEVERVEADLCRFAAAGATSAAGARVIFKEEAANLPAPLAGHEHFGFLDGVSQPGIRGRASNAEGDFITPRANPDNPDQGKPGQDLLWPGEFVFGYAGQPDTGDEFTTKGPIAVSGADPELTENGSYLVFRRLRQRVGQFHQFLKQRAEGITPDSPGAGPISPGLIGARLVGRWASGAPAVRAPEAEVPGLGDDDCENNRFEFNEDEGEPPTTTPATAEACKPNGFTPLPTDDPSGSGCPFTAHIRKSYPRNDFQPGTTSLGENEVQSQHRRLLRRGIPYGPVSRSTFAQPDPTGDFDETASDAHNRGKDRGLHFLAYQTSIVDQFEFVTRFWVNNPNFSQEQAQRHGSACPASTRPDGLDVGFDPIIGQNSAAADRRRHFFARVGPGGSQCVRLETTDDWVIPTGGGYFFAPSIKALKEKIAR